MEYRPLINCADLPKTKRQPISKRKVAGWLFYIALNAVLLYVIYEGFVMRGAI